MYQQMQQKIIKLLRNDHRKTFLNESKRQTPLSFSKSYVNKKYHGDTFCKVDLKMRRRGTPHKS